MEALGSPSGLIELLKPDCYVNVALGSHGATAGGGPGDGFILHAGPESTIGRSE